MCSLAHSLYSLVQFRHLLLWFCGHLLDEIRQLLLHLKDTSLMTNKGILLTGDCCSHYWCARVPTARSRHHTYLGFLAGFHCLVQMLLDLHIH